MKNPKIEYKLEEIARFFEEINELALSDGDSINDYIDLEDFITNQCKLEVNLVEVWKSSYELCEC